MIDFDARKNDETDEVIYFNTYNHLLEFVTVIKAARKKKTYFEPAVQKWALVTA